MHFVVQASRMARRPLSTIRHVEVNDACARPGRGHLSSQSVGVANARRRRSTGLPASSTTPAHEMGVLPAHGLPESAVSALAGRRVSQTLLGSISPSSRCSRRRKPRSRSGPASRTRHARRQERPEPPRVWRPGCRRNSPVRRWPLAVAIEREAVPAGPARRGTASGYARSFVADLSESTVVFHVLTPNRTVRERVVHDAWSTAG